MQRSFPVSFLHQSAHVQAGRACLLLACLALSACQIAADEPAPRPASEPTIISGVVDSYASAAEITSRIHQHDGQAVRIDLMAVRPYWRESDCAFMLWTRYYGTGEPPGIANGGGEEFCVTDAAGEQAIFDDEVLRQWMSIRQDTLRFRGDFFVRKDFAPGHVGVFPIGLVPLRPAK